jgi:glutamate dehydrogenase/leucine dehydrogenase
MCIGGADFNPHNKSEAEIQRFCGSYMLELAKYIAPDLDVVSFAAWTLYKAYL